MHLDTLDAREAWPPLLRPRVLMGHEGYEYFEQYAIEEILAPAAKEGVGCAETLQELLRWVTHGRAWQSTGGSTLLEHLRNHPTAGVGHSPPRPIEPLLNDLVSAVPVEWRPLSWPHGLTDEDLGGPTLARREAESALLRYVGTRLVGSWIAYQGEGVLSVVASLVSSYALAASALAVNGGGVVTVGRMASAIRAADWLQLHLLDRDDWADWCREWERTPDAPGELSGWLAAGQALLDELAWAAPSASSAGRSVAAS